MIALRKSSEALRDGEFIALDAPDPVLAFERRTDSARLLCLFNLGPEPALRPLPPCVAVSTQVPVPVVMVTVEPAIVHAPLAPTLATNDGTEELAVAVNVELYGEEAGSAPNESACVALAAVTALAISTAGW